MRVTIKDIALRSGVSPTTVSLYLNGHRLAARISAGTKQRIDEAIAVTGYAPSAAARALRLGRTKTLGVIVGEVANEYYSHVVELAIKEAKGYGYQLIVAITNWDAEEEKRALDNLISHQIDGILDFCFCCKELSLRQQLQKDKYPLVLLDYPRDLSFPVVQNDLRKSVNDAVAHLHQLGHDEIHGVFSLLTSWEGVFLAACKHQQVLPNLVTADLAPPKSRLAIVREICKQRPRAIILNGRRTTRILLRHINATCPDYTPDIIMAYDHFCDYIADKRVSGVIATYPDKLIKAAIKKLVAILGSAEPLVGERIMVPTDFIPRSEFAKLQRDEQYQQARQDY